jgi:hypothetical protein
MNDRKYRDWVVLKSILNTGNEERIRALCLEIAIEEDDKIKNKLKNNLLAFLNSDYHSFSGERDYIAYRTAMLSGNIFAIEFFTEIGLDPFDPNHPLHTRLFNGDDSIIKTLAILRKCEQNQPELKDMIEWILDRLVQDSLSSKL